MAYEYLKDLPRRTTSDKVLQDKVHAITKNSKYYQYQRGCASVVYISFYKTSLGGAVTRKRVTRNVIQVWDIFSRDTSIRAD